MEDADKADQQRQHQQQQQQQQRQRHSSEISFENHVSLSNEQDIDDRQQTTPTELIAVQELDQPTVEEISEHAVLQQTDHLAVLMKDDNATPSEARPSSHHGHAAGPIHEDDAQGAQKGEMHGIEPCSVKEPREDKLVLESFVLYKTESKFYVVGSNQSDSRYRVLKIDRHYDPADTIHELHVTEDAIIYNKNEIADLLQMIDVGNKHAGGLQKVTNFYGILGFVRFTGSWYMITIRARAPVALIGGHYVYHCEDSVMTAITDNVKVARPAEENRLLAAFQQVDLSKNFYFSYSYDLTNTLQTNFTKTALRKIGKHGIVSTQLPPNMHWVAQQAFHEPSEHDFNAASARQPEIPVADGMAWGFNDRFIWNHFLLQPAFGGTMAETDKRSCWVLPLIHGFVDQAKLSVYGRVVYITLVARRSRHFAGARFLKRGVNDEGNVANDVESEQIVSEALTTTFYSYSNNARRPVPRYTSFVQHRGSIPLSWQQDTSTSSLKPPIHLHLVDPYHAAAALHFDDLFARYGTPITCLNLIKGKEREPRESKLAKPFEECISYLNQFLPETKKIKYIALDMSSAYKNKNTNVIEVLEEIAGDVLQDTSFFHSGATPFISESLDVSSRESRRSQPQLQRGVCRTNCIDCLDRTNAAQFVIAKAAMGLQLHALGILAEPDLRYDTDAADILTEMYHDHGDTIALQYGGSHLVNTMNTYRKINQWKSHSRDMIEGLKRFYANVALDQEKQNSINIFLGIASAPVPRQQISHSLTATVAASGSLSPASFISAIPSAVGSQGNHPASPVAAGNTQLVRSTDDLARGVERSTDTATLDDEDADVLMPVRVRRDYRHWFTPEFLEKIPSVEEAASCMRESELEEGNIWTAYYRTKLFTQFERHFAIRINSTTRYSAHIPKDISEKNMSPFKVRQPPPKSHWARGGSKIHRVTSGEPSRNAAFLVGSSDHEESDNDTVIPSATDGLAQRLLKPKVRPSEAMEYRCYVEQYRNLNLSDELLFESSEGDLRMYERAISLSAGGRHLLNSLSIDQASMEAYEKHCKVMRPWQEVI